MRPRLPLDDSTNEATEKTQNISTCCCHTMTTSMKVTNALKMPSAFMAMPDDSALTSLEFESV